MGWSGSGSGGTSTNVTISGAVDTELTTVDLDSGGGTDSRVAVGILLSASGGSVAWPGSTLYGGLVDIARMPAAQATTDSMVASLRTDKISNNLSELTPKFAKANIASATTDGAVVAAVSLKKIRVLSFRVHAGSTATTVTFTSKPAGAGTAISEVFACGANGGRSEQFSPVGHFETVSGEGLSVTTGTGSTVGIGVVYVEV